MGRLKHIPERITEKRPKVYFSCHKDDFTPFFEEISSEILKGRSCSVWYDEDIDGERDKNFYFDLSQMTLFVMPITTRLLTTKNRALDEELSFAVEHHIPILPLMQEDGLEELFNKKFGNLQFLTKHSTDRTEISYEEKLNKFLSSVLLDDKTIKRIQAEFDGYIFLSYRKKDRIHAQRLMQLIHKNDFCRDIAIWYDEFLTPGENFNENIKKALDKSELFVLAVTPSLLEPRIDENGNKCKNYIEEHEYPMAYNAHKAILPVKLVRTNRIKLSLKYKKIPKCISADNTNELADALMSQLKSIAKPENDTNPEHNYLIGLAYLDGIDVERDYNKALALIESAANADNLEAINKLIEIHQNGIAVVEHDSLIPSNDITDPEYDPTLDFDDVNDSAFDPIPNPKSIWNNLSKTFSKQEKNNRTFNKEFREESSAIDAAFANEANEIQAFGTLSSGHNSLGNIYKNEGNFSKAKAHYLKAIAIIEPLAKKTNNPSICYALAIYYHNLAKIFPGFEGRKYLRKALAILHKLCEQCPDIPQYKQFRETIQNELDSLN